MTSDLKAQIEDARKHVKKLKKVTPYIFPQWSRLKCAETALEKAKQELKAAKAAWEAL